MWHVVGARGAYPTDHGADPAGHALLLRVGSAPEHDDHDADHEHEGSGDHQ